MRSSRLTSRSVRGTPTAASLAWDELRYFTISSTQSTSLTSLARKINKAGFIVDSVSRVMGSPVGSFPKAVVWLPPSGTPAIRRCLILDDLVQPPVAYRYEDAYDINDDNQLIATLQGPSGTFQQAIRLPLVLR